MFELTKTFAFEAGHCLKDHDGTCVRPHGHSYKLTVVIRSETLIEKGPSIGMVMDFQAISSIVRPMLEKFFDHHWLNETLEIESPTAECMAKWIFEYLQPNLPGLYCITIHETATSAASYFSSI